MTTADNAPRREVRYPAWFPAREAPLGKIVRTGDVPAHALDVLSGNPHDEGTDWTLLGPAINGAREFTIGLFRMEPNQAHPPHYHPVGPEFYYIVAGSCLLQVDDDVHEVGPETAIYLPEGTVHAVWTREGEAVTILYGFDERPGERVSTVWLE